MIVDMATQNHGEEEGGRRIRRRVDATVSQGRLDSVCSGLPDLRHDPRVGLSGTEFRDSRSAWSEFPGPVRLTEQ